MIYTAKDNPYITFIFNPAAKHEAVICPKGEKIYVPRFNIALVLEEDGTEREVPYTRIHNHNEDGACGYRSHEHHTWSCHQNRIIRL